MLKSSVTYSDLDSKQDPLLGDQPHCQLSSAQFSPSGESPVTKTHSSTNAFLNESLRPESRRFPLTYPSLHRNSLNKKFNQRQARGSNGRNKGTHGSSSNCYPQWWKAHSTHWDVTHFELAQAKDREKQKNHVSAGPSNFSNVWRDISRRLPETTGHMPSRAEPIEQIGKKKTRHGFLHNCQPPACQGIPVGTTGSSGWTQCQAEKTGDIEQTNVWATQQHKCDRGGEQIFSTLAQLLNDAFWGRHEPKILSRYCSLPTEIDTSRLLWEDRTRQGCEGLHFATVRRAFVPHIMEEEDEEQKNEKEDGREDGQQRAEGRVVENQNNHIMSAWRWLMECDVCTPNLRLEPRMCVSLYEKMWRVRCAVHTTRRL